MDQFTMEDSLRAWTNNADFWENAMGQEGNEFHRTVVRPRVSRLLEPGPEDFILDIACGEGSYSAYMAKKGARVTAFDFSPRLIELARKKQAMWGESIEFCVADAGNYRQLMALSREVKYNKAVSNMAIMDITHVEPLFQAVEQLLEDKGIFVFATQHPCFVTLTEKYMTPHSYYGEAIAGQPSQQCYYHRSLQDIFRLCFDAGFVVEDFYEECFRNPEWPEIIVVKARKTGSGQGR